VSTAQGGREKAVGNRLGAASVRIFNKRIWMLFRSFWQAGFECSTQKLKSGKRLDEVAFTNHDRFAGFDFERMRALGMETAREGLRWHLIERTPHRYDFSSALPIMEAAQQNGIQIIWDLFHFGWPDHLDIFSPAWVDSLGELADNFALLLRREMSGMSFVAPVNEISFVAWAGGDTAYLNPFQVGRGAELKRQLVRGFASASEALRSVLPDVRLVSPEPVIHIVGDPNRPDDVKQAAEYRSAMFESWDMLSGRVQPELGGHESYLDIIGINYYDRNQWWNFGQTIWRHEPDYRPFREILNEVYERYHRPMFISETGTEDDDRPHWLHYIASEVRAAIRGGAPIHGICLYPILNHPGWDDDRHCYNGLWDYASPDGFRQIYEPLAEEIERQKDLGLNHELSNKSTKPFRHTVSVASSLELCFPASAALDEQVCEGPEGLLLGGACS
jgi:beta-glucosidase/6-phospho-beta-glucosidase/beta-galactosidase